MSGSGTEGRWQHGSSARPPYSRWGASSGGSGRGGPPMLSRRGLLVVAVVAVVLLGSALALLFTGGNDDQSSESPNNTPPSVGPGPALDPVLRGAQPPSTGAWTGAWVRPDIPTQQGQLDGVAAFERAVGRPLDVVQVYHQWDDDFPTSADKTFV